MKYETRIELLICNIHGVRGEHHVCTLPVFLCGASTVIKTCAVSQIPPWKWVRYCWRCSWSIMLCRFPSCRISMSWENYKAHHNQPLISALGLIQNQREAKLIHCFDVEWMWGGFPDVDLEAVHMDWITLEKAVQNNRNPGAILPSP